MALKIDGMYHRLWCVNFHRGLRVTIVLQGICPCDCPSKLAWVDPGALIGELEPKVVAWTL
jgi:hypothetical protein